MFKKEFKRKMYVRTITFGMKINFDINEYVNWDEYLRVIGIENE